MSAESLTQGSTSVKDSVTPFSVIVKLSAPANAAGALSRSAAAAMRSVRERRIVDLLVVLVRASTISPRPMQFKALGSRRGVANGRPSSLGCFAYIDTHGKIENADVHVLLDVEP